MKIPKVPAYLYRYTFIDSIDGRVITYDQCVEFNTDCGAGFGNHIKILKDDGVLILYAHLATVAVKTGDVVKVGQFIGVEGNTGLTGLDNRHLHFNVHQDWRVNGFSYYKKYLGSLPDSIPFSMNICQEKYKTCNTLPVDVRHIKCKRVTGATEWVNSTRLKGSNILNKINRNLVHFLKFES